MPSLTAASLSRKRVSKLSVPSTRQSTPFQQPQDVGVIDVGDDRVDLDGRIDRAGNFAPRSPWAVRRPHRPRRTAPAAVGCSAPKSRDRRFAACPRRRGPACWRSRTQAAADDQGPRCQLRCLDADAAQTASGGRNARFADQADWRRKRPRRLSGGEPRITRITRISRTTRMKRKASIYTI